MPEAGAEQPLGAKQRPAREWPPVTERSANERRLPPYRDRYYGADSVNDAGEGQNASGSWQPDPTGRYKLRWQLGTGEWTDHVYSSEGELGNDPYDTPPPTPSPPGVEMPDLGDSPHSAGAPKPPKRRRKKLLIALGVIIGLFIVLAIIGSFIPDPETTSTEPSPPTTTARTETTRATTTTARQTTTTQSLASTEEDCAVRSSLMGMLSGEVIGLFEELSLQSAIGDIEGMQETYGIIAWTMADLPDMTRETIEICRPHAPQATLDAIESNFAVAEAGWRELQQTCRSDLAPLGFDCETGTLGYSTSEAASPGADAEAASELTARERTCADNWETISYSEMLRMKRDRSIDGIYDWSGGYWVSYDKIMDIC